MPRYDPVGAYRFRVDLDGIEVAHFKECSGFDINSDEVKYEEGGLNSGRHRLPGRYYYSDLTLKKGIARDGAPLWRWVQDAVNGNIQTREVTVILLDVAGEPVLRLNFTRAFPVKWSATGLVGGSAEIAIETLTLAHQGMTFAQ